MNRTLISASLIAVFALVACDKQPAAPGAAPSPAPAAAPAMPSPAASAASN